MACAWLRPTAPMARLRTPENRLWLFNRSNVVRGGVPQTRLATLRTGVTLFGLFSRMTSPTIVVRVTGECWGVGGRTVPGAGRGEGAGRGGGGRVGSGKVGAWVAGEGGRNSVERRAAEVGSGNSYSLKEIVGLTAPCDPSRSDTQCLPVKSFF